MPVLRRQWFLIGLLAVLMAGFGATDQVAPLALALPKEAIIVAVLFLMALPLETAAIKRIILAPTAALLGTAVNFLVVPFFAWLCRPLLFDQFGIGLVVAAAVPSTLASAAVWTRRAGGNDAVALLVTVITNVSCFLVTPAILWVLLRQQVEIAFGPLVYRLAMLVVLPVVMAQICRQQPALARWADARQPQLSLLAQVGILSIVLVGAVHGGRTLASLQSDAAIGIADWVALGLASLAVHLASFVVGWLSGRGLGLSTADRIAVAFSGSQKTLMAGLAVALEFPGLVALPMVVFHVIQLVVDTLIADGCRRRRAALAD